MVEEGKAEDEAAFLIDRDIPAIADARHEIQQPRVELLLAAPLARVVAGRLRIRTRPSRRCGRIGRLRTVLEDRSRGERLPPLPSFCCTRRTGSRSSRDPRATSAGWHGFEKQVIRVLEPRAFFAAFSFRTTNSRFRDSAIRPSAAATSTAAPSCSGDFPRSVPERYPAGGRIGDEEATCAPADHRAPGASPRRALSVFRKPHRVVKAPA